MDSDYKYPIREVSQLTGVNPVTLRAWQRRYGLIKPGRTASGHRLYSDADVQLIRQILSWLDKGVSIGKIKALLNEPETQPLEDNWLNTQQQLMQLAQALNLKQLESLIVETSKLYPSELWLRHIIEPWLKQLSLLQRADQLLIEQSARRLLGNSIEKMITIQTGPYIALLQVGESSSLDSRLTRYELQSLQCRCYDLGQGDPAQLLLSMERLPVQAYLLLLGSGLNANWFAQKQARLPPNTFYCGQMGRIYQNQDWLSQPYSESVTQLVRQHEKAFGLV